MSRRKKLFSFTALAFILVFMMAAQDPCEPVPPPFDATGEFEGEWWSGTGEHCPVSVDFTMNAAPVFPPLWTPAGVFHVDFGCIEMPPEFPPIPPTDIQTLGLLDEYSNLTFNAFGCTYGLCLWFDTVGVGVDEDEDGFMDYYSGTWAYIFLVAGLQPFGVAGEFELFRVAD